MTSSVRRRLPACLSVIRWLALGVLGVLGALLGGCGGNASPSYPSDWPDLARASPQQLAGENCPDLSGLYDLPANAAAPVRGGRKGDFQSVHHLLGINSQHSRWLGMPAQMKLEGPNAAGLQVTFYKPNGDVTVEGSLQPGRDFVCAGKWITETQGQHGDDYLKTSYARDVDGRLIGFQGQSGAYAGLVEVFGVPIPLAGVSFLRLWWRIEPAR